MSVNLTFYQMFHIYTPRPQIKQLQNKKSNNFLFWVPPQQKTKKLSILIANYTQLRDIIQSIIRLILQDPEWSFYNPQIPVRIKLHSYQFLFYSMLPPTQQDNYCINLILPYLKQTEILVSIIGWREVPINCSLV